MLNGIEEIEGLTAEQIKGINGLVTGLVSNKQDVLAQNGELKSQLTGNDAELVRLRLIEQNLEQSKLVDKENYSGALELNNKQHEANFEKLTISSGEKDQLIHKLLVENGLSAELIKLNVNPDLMGLIQQGLSATASVIDGQAMIGDKSLSEYMTEWADTPQGKASRIASSNSGGDASGGGNVPTGKKMADMSGQERTALFQQNPTEFNRLKAEM